MSEKKAKGPIREFLEAIFIAFLVAIIIRTFVIQAYTIPSGSMLETLQIGDYLLINKFTYGVKNPFSDEYIIEGSDPQIGDIIVFPYPQDPKVDYIKRIVGTPGDVLEIKNKQLYRNGVLVEEAYVEHYHPFIVNERDNMKPIIVPEDKYFVMGDNRDYSLDSRYWGFVDRNAIHGKAWRFYFSWNPETNRPRLNRIGKKVHQEIEE